jgi:competence protein ComEC
MNSFRQFPLLRLIVPVFLGIAQGIFCETEIKIPLSLVIILFFCFGFLIVKPESIFPYSFQWITGILIFLLTAALSDRIMISGKDILKNDYFGNFQPVQKYCIGEIIEPVIRKEKSTKAVIRVTFVKENGKWLRTVGKALVFLENSPCSQLLCYGDRLLMNTQFTEPEGSRNPAGFDNKRYLRLKELWLQAHVKKGHWVIISRETRDPVFRLALSWRDKMLMLLRKNGMKGNEFAVAGALLLGYVDEVDNDLMHDYSATGVMHILSVSGMHVGMIFLVLDKLLAFLDKRKNGGYAKALLVICFIWLYALITGLSPAVMRAAGMLSLLVSGKAMKRHPDTLNVLAASAIFLLIWQPVLLADPGFQLSYLAVGGIVLLYKPVYNLYVPGNLVLDKVWSIVAVSIAAQLATLPLCLYYFHQFPNYFIVTNIIVIPLSNLIIYTGILAIALGNIPWISFLVARILSLMIWFLNSFIHWMGALPFSVFRGIVISVPEFIVLFSVLISGVAFFSSKKKKWLFVSLSLMILLSGNFLWERYRQVSVSKFTVYDVRGQGLCDFITGGKSILVGGLSALKEPFFLDAFRKSRWNEKVTGLFGFQYPLPLCHNKPFHYGNLFYKKGNFIGFGGKRIVILDQKIRDNSNLVLGVDYLIVSGNPGSDLKDILRHFKPGIVILDASNAPWKVKKWIKEAHWLGVHCYSVSASGAFTDKF